MNGPSRQARGERGPVRLYVVIVTLYAVLLAWWVLFLGGQADRLAARMAEREAPLTGAQTVALQDASGESMRMFLFEGAFMGLLMLGSVWLVMRALKKEIQLNRQHRNFLSAVTHELRSPLASARLYVESILLGRTDDEKTMRYLKNAHADLLRLGDMIEDVLTARRLMEAGPDLHLERLELGELLTRQVESLARVHDTQERALVLVRPPLAFVKGDGAALSQVLDNLVSNAFKYGEDDVTVTLEREGDLAVLEVRDGGAGLGGADVRSLYEPFVRGGDEDVRTRPGAGLGLSIVTQLVDAHGGRFTLTDAETGPGAVARVELPLLSLGEGAGEPAPALEVGS